LIKGQKTDNDHADVTCSKCIVSKSKVNYIKEPRSASVLWHSLSSIRKSILPVKILFLQFPTALFWTIFWGTRPHLSNFRRKRK